MTSLEQTLDTLWNYTHPQESEKKFKALLKQEASHQAEILTQIARALGLQGKFPEAHQKLDEIESLPKDPRVQVRYLLERGRLYNSAGQKDKARALFLEAYQLSQTIPADFYTIDAAHMMAIVEPPQEQILWHERCLELCEKSNDERAGKWLGSILNNAAWTFHDLGQYEKALAIFQKAQNWHEQHGKPQTMHIARWSVARCLRSMGHLEEALSIQKQLAAKENDGYVVEEIAECLLALGKPTEARPYFAQAYDLLSPDHWLANNETQRLERLRNLATTL